MLSFVKMKLVKVIASRERMGDKDLEVGERFFTVCSSYSA